jgi:hypothetical protein
VWADIAPEGMFVTLLVGCSLLLQGITIVLSLRLISVTGWKKAWLCVSFGIASMGVRRLITFIGLLSGDLNHSSEMSYEIIGLVGSAVMLGGVAFIKPIFLSLQTAEREQREIAARLHDALSRVKRLSGLLPICAWCKKVRDDKGYWNQIESYLHEHSEAEFSHGICPECEKKVLSEYADKKTDEGRQ